MVKIVNGIIVQDGETSPLTSSDSSSFPLTDFELNIKICDYTLNKWMIMGNNSSITRSSFCILNDYILF